MMEANYLHVNMDYKYIEYIKVVTVYAINEMTNRTFLAFSTAKYGCYEKSNSICAWAVVVWLSDTKTENFRLTPLNTTIKHVKLSEKVKIEES